ncbi:hypothetical protein ES703_15633 [subsurface metagenome]
MRPIPLPPRKLKKRLALPKAKPLCRNKVKSKIGCASLPSMIKKVVSDTTPATPKPSTKGENHPLACP